MHSALRRRRRDQGIPIDPPTPELLLPSQELASDIACLREKDDALARHLGLPTVGSTMLNAHGIEWQIDGYTSAASVASYNYPDRATNLYPVVVPQNLSERLTEFIAEINRCTPKCIVPLDTLPYRFPNRAHPGGHSVDAWSDPYRILLFLDAASVHETIFAHELAHVWIDLVNRIEDHRVLKDKSDTARYSQVQLIQSFVLDIAVNDVLRRKGFDTSIIDADQKEGLFNLAGAAQDGYKPPSRREALFMAQVLAANLVDEAHGRSIVRQGDHILAIRSHLPDVHALAQSMAVSVTSEPLRDAESARRLIDAVVTLSFEYTDGGIDLEDELIHIEPQTDWNRDKHPEWLKGQPIQAKCEIGRAMAKVAADSNSECFLSDFAGPVFASFTLPDGSTSQPQRIVHAQPSVNPGDFARRIMEANNANRQRVAAARPSFTPQNTPHGLRTYSAGMGAFLTRVRWQEIRQGEVPYAYAMGNPTTYNDPTGLSPQFTNCEFAGIGWMSGPLARGERESRLTRFTRCQRGLEAQFKARELLHYPQLCPRGLAEICEACARVSGLKVNCGGYPSCSSPGGGSTQGFDWGKVGGIAGSIIPNAGDFWKFDDAACYRTCYLLPGLLVATPNKKFIKAACVAACNALRDGGCEKLFARCVQMGDTPQGDNCMLFYIFNCEQAPKGIRGS
jgi:hypothetical protein